MENLSPAERAQARLNRATGGGGAGDDRQRAEQRLRDAEESFAFGPTRARAQAQERLEDVDAPILDLITQSARRGFARFRQNLSASGLQDVVVDPRMRRAPDDVAASAEELRQQAADEIRSIEATLREMDTTPQMRRLGRAIQESPEISMESARRIGRAVAEDPAAALGLGIESTAQQPVSAVATGLAGLMGAGPLAASAAGAAGGFLTEARFAQMEALRRADVDLTDEEAIAEALNDPEIQQSARERGIRRGASIAAVDLASNLLTGGLANRALNPLARAALGLGVQTGGEAAGEALAQQAAGDEAQFGEIAAEAIGAGPQSLVETAGLLAAGREGQGGARRQLRQRIRDVEAPDRPPQPAEEAPETTDRPLADMDDQQLEQARERALEKKDEPTLELIEEELEIRNEAEMVQEAGETLEQQAQQETQEQQAAQEERSTLDEIEEQLGIADPEQAQQQARQQAADRLEQAETDRDRGADAMERLGLGDIQPDPRPDLDARIQDVQTPDEPQEPQEAEAAAQEDEEAAGAPEAPEGDQTEGEQGELAENLGARTRTRPEEQVREAVEEQQNVVRERQEQVEEATATLESILSEATDEELQQVAQSTDSERVETAARTEMQRRGGQTATMFGEAQTPAQQATPTQGLFEEGEGRNVSSAVEHAVNRVTQREAGLEQAQQELLRIRQQQPEAERQARESQTDLTEQLEEDDTTEQPAPPAPESEEGAQEAREGAGRPETGERPEPAEEDGEGAGARPEGRIEEPQRDVVEPTVTEEGDLDTGTVTIRVPDREGRPIEATASITEEELRVEPVERGVEQSEQVLGLMAEEAARRDLEMVTAREISAEQGRAIMQLEERGYNVTRHPEAEHHVDGTMSAIGGPVFRVSAPQIDPQQASLQLEDGRTVGRARRPVTRQTTTSSGRRMTTYRHSRGDIVVTNPEGRLIDRRSSGYDEAIVEFFREHEEQLRDGSVDPGTRDEDAYLEAAATSQSPQQVLEAFTVQRRRIQEGAASEADPVAEAIDDQPRFSTDSFDEFADPNWRNDSGQVRMNWLGGQRDLDAAAQEISSDTGIEVTPQDIVDHIMENQAGPQRRSPEQERLDRLTDQFRDLTGIKLTPELAEDIQAAQLEDVSTSDDVQDIDAPFQRLAGDGVMSADAYVEAVVRRLLGEQGLPQADVNVVMTPSDLPGPLRDVYETGARNAGDGMVQPAMFVETEEGAEVYIVAEAVQQTALALGHSTESMARATILHEVVAHKGLRGLFGEQFTKVMGEVYEAVGPERILNTRTADGTRLADAYADQIRVVEGQITPESRALLADEYLARIAEGLDRTRTVLERIYTTLRDAVARVLNLEITRTELELLLEAARDHRRAQEAGNPVTSTRFDRRMDDRFPVRWMMLGTGARDFEAADAEGRTFRGPYDNMERFEISDADAALHPDGPIKRYADTVRRELEAKQRKAESEETNNTDLYVEATQELDRAQADRRDIRQSMSSGVRLDEVLSHESLYEQYPDLREVRVTLRRLRNNNTAWGSLSADENRLYVFMNAMNTVEAAVRRDEETLRDALSEVMGLLLHEVQHWIQFEEGFAIGSNPADMRSVAQTEVSTAQALHQENGVLGDATAVAIIMEQQDVSADTAIEQFEEAMDRPLRDRARAFGERFDWSESALQEEVERNLEAMRKRGLDPQNPRERAALQQDEEAEEQFIERRARQLYQQSAGEIEARITARRRGMTAEQRQQDEAFNPEVLDVYPPGEVITRFSRVQGSPDQMELFHDPQSGAAGPQNMVVLHNMTGRALVFVLDRMDGHLPVPSLATTRYDQSFSNFGPITLVGNPDMVAPENGVPTFDSDIYSPRTPDLIHPVDEAGIETFFRTFGEYFQATGETSTASALDQYARQGNRQGAKSQLIRSAAGRVWYLEEQHGVEYDMPRKDFDGRHSAILNHGPLEDMIEKLLEKYGDMQGLQNAVAKGRRSTNPVDARALMEAIRSSAKAVSVSRYGEVMPELAAAHFEPFEAGSTGTINIGPLSALLRSYRKKQEDPRPVDRAAIHDETDQMIEERTEETPRAVLARWAEDKMEQIFQPPRVRDPETGEPRPLALDTMVDMMTRQGVQAAESTVFNTLSEARAAGARQFESLEEMQAERDRLIPRAEMDRLSEELNDDFMELADAMREYTSVRGFGYLSRVSEAMADMLQRRRTEDQARESLDVHGFDVEDMPQQLVTEFVEFGTTLVESPTQYFEAKPQRAVALSEFEAAIVPDSLEPELQDMLAEAIGRVETYAEENVAERQEKVAEVSGEEDVRFRRSSPEVMALRFQRSNGGPLEGETRENMVVLHNFSDRGVRWVLDKMDGKIPAPSIAVADVEEGFSGFGGVSLIGSPAVIDPAEGTPVFAADAYTPTTPSTLSVIPTETVREEVEPVARDLIEDVRAFDPALANQLEYRLGDDFAEILGGRGTFNFKQVYESTPFETLRQFRERGNFEARVRDVVEGRDDPVRALAERQVSPQRRNTFVDALTTREMLDTPEGMVPATPENVAREMTRGQIVAAQTASGVGPTRAIGARRFESIEDIQRFRDRLVSDVEMSAVQDRIDKKLDEVQATLRGVIGPGQYRSASRQNVLTVVQEIFGREQEGFDVTQPDVMAMLEDRNGDLAEAAPLDFLHDLEAEARQARREAEAAMAEGQDRLAALLPDRVEETTLYTVMGEERERVEIDLSIMTDEEVRLAARMSHPAFEPSRYSDYQRYASRLIERLQERAEEGDMMMDILMERDPTASLLTAVERIEQAMPSLMEMQSTDPDVQAALSAFEASLAAQRDADGDLNQINEQMQLVEEARQGAEELLELADVIREAETQYFEAKPTRAVALSEFSGAAVPDTFDDQLAKRLEEAIGGPVRRYNAGFGDTLLDVEITIQGQPIGEAAPELRGLTEDIRLEVMDQLDGLGLDTVGPAALGAIAEEVNLALNAQFGREAADAWTDAVFEDGEPVYRVEPRWLPGRIELVEQMSEDLDVRFARRGQPEDADVPPQSVTKIRSASDWAQAARGWWREFMTSRGNLPQSVFEAVVERNGELKAVLQRAKWSLHDFGRALERHYGTQRISQDEAETINNALSNGYRENDIQQGQLFEDDQLLPQGTKQSELYFSRVPFRPRMAEIAEKTYIDDLPEEVQKATARLRDEIDALSRAAIASGLFSGKLKAVVTRNIGTYLTRSYRIHQDPGWAAQVREIARQQTGEEAITIRPEDVPEEFPAQEWNRAVGWFRQTHPHMSDQQIVGRLLELMNVESANVFTGGAQLGSVGSAIFERRKDIPEPLRALMGELTDPRDNYSQSMVKMAHAVSNQNLLNKVKKAGLNEFLFEEPKVEDGVEYTTQIAAEGSQTMSPLNGLYTTEEIAEAFQTFDTTEAQPWWWEYLMWPIVTLKLGKTVLSPRTQVRNLLGNIPFAISQGHLFEGTATEAQRQAWKKSIAALRENQTEEQRQDWQRLTRLGIVGDAIRAGELEDLLGDVNIDLSNPQEAMGNIFTAAVRKSGRVASRLYQLGDELWKVFAFHIERQRYAEARPDLTEQELDDKAATIVRNTYPTYSLVPDVVKKLRRLPTNAPFVSFFSEVFRTSYHTVQQIRDDLSDPRTRSIGMKRAIGSLVAQSMFFAAGKASLMLTGIDSEEDDLLRRLLPSWSQFSNIFHLGRGEDEKSWGYIDLGYLNPYKAYTESVIALMQGRQNDVAWGEALARGLGRLFEPFYSEEIFTQKLREAILNRRTESGGPIVNTERPIEDQMVGRITHVLKGFEPGFARTGRRIYEAATEEGLGRQKDLTQEILSPITGQRIKQIDMASALKWETIDYERRYREASMIASTTLTADGVVAREEIRSAYEESHRAKEQLIRHVHKDLQAVMHFNLSPREAFRVMRSNNVGRDRALMAMAGRYVPTLNEQVLEGRIESAEAEGRAEDVEELRRRRRIALEVQQEIRERYIEEQPSLRQAFEDTRRLLQEDQFAPRTNGQPEP